MTSMNADDGEAGVIAGRSLRFRQARREEVPAIVRLLADDALGSSREHYAEPLPQAYWDAFDAIAARPDNLLIVAEMDGAVVGCLQLTLIPGLTRLGAWRALIEGVRVDSRCRGQRVGERLLRYAIDQARAQGCRLVQLTTDKTRSDAHQFYERLGFVGSHLGMKLALD
ncbi:N-acetyltransferase family protein [Virgifigura deserti]|uniref:GNAT family N-acetyltransferase n=1 Tax=Virgifigura deserti TaxID=2268457 RepID=UPI003CCBC785